MVPSCVLRNKFIRRVFAKGTVFMKPAVPQCINICVDREGDCSYLSASMFAWIERVIVPT